MKSRGQARQIGYECYELWCSSILYGYIGGYKTRRLLDGYIHQRVYISGFATAVVGYWIGYTDSWVYTNVKDNSMRIEISVGRYTMLSE